MKTIESTVISKGMSGWNGKSYVRKFEMDWAITTFKGSRGQIVCSAQSGTYKKEDGGTSFSHEIFGSDPQKELITKKAMGTRKNIEAIHNEGMEIFSRLSDYK